MMFQSFFIGGFECSTHRGRDGRRHDLVAATFHDAHARQDYEQLRACGITTVREGLRWHLIERQPERFDFSSVLPILKAARQTQTQVLWDLFHYGYPDDTNPFDDGFVYRFAQFAYAFACFLRDETDETPFICPFNELSFFTYAAGERGFFAPYQQERGDELKPKLARASLEAARAVRSVLPAARLLQIDPVFNVLPHPERPQDRETAESYRLAQYEGWDMLGGRMKPELGGGAEFLDIIGVNYYSYNQWFLAENPVDRGVTIHAEDEHYRPFREILREVYERYGRPIFIGETGTEDDKRASWLNYVCTEALAAMRSGVPVIGLCWYPILNHPGWDDDRHCHNGLLDYADDRGSREFYEPLRDELLRQQILMSDFIEPDSFDSFGKIIEKREFSFV